MRKLTQEEFEARVYAQLGDRIDLSEFEYTGVNGKSIVICPTHGEYRVSAGSLLVGRGCGKCASARRTGSKPKRKVKPPLEAALTPARKPHGGKFEYDMTTYENSRKPMRIICPKHGEFWASMNKHKYSKHGCSKCGQEKLVEKTINSRKGSDVVIPKFIERFGDRYDFSKAAFEKSSDIFTVICREHGEFQTTATRLGVATVGCPVCARLVANKNTMLSLDKVHAKLHKKHGDKYTFGNIVRKQGSDRKVRYINVTCPTHGTNLQLLATTKTGYACRDCAIDSRADEARKTLGEFLEKAKAVHGEIYDYSLVKYRSATETVRIICKKHGEFLQRPNNHLRGAGCPSCSNNYATKPQVEIFDFISQYIEAEIEAPFKGKSRRRHDILIPSLNLAVEHHGLIWHSTRFKKDPRSDYKRHLQAESFGVRTIHIYEDEWRFQREVVKRTLLAAIGALPKIAVEKTNVVEVDQEEAFDFLNANHLLGAPQSGTHLGLVENGELVMCASFVHRSGRLWELTRYAATKNVERGLDRLIKVFLERGDCNKLEAFTDTRLSGGSELEQIGFTFDRELEPDYTCIKDGYGPRKDKLEFKLMPGEKGYRVYDCGQRRWILNP